MKLSGTWNSDNNRLSISKGTSGSDSLSYGLSASPSITYNSSTHKYRATAQALVDGTARGAASGTDSGTEAYDDGNTYGYNRAHVAGSWGTGNNSNVWTVSKTTSGSSNSTSLTVTAGVSSQSYNSTTHKYTAYGYAYGNGTQKASSGGSVSGTEAYDAGYSSGYSAGFDANHSIWLEEGQTGSVANIGGSDNGPHKYRIHYKNNAGNWVYVNQTWESPGAWLATSSNSQYIAELEYDTVYAVVKTWSNGSSSEVGRWKTKPKGSSHNTAFSMQCTSKSTSGIIYTYTFTMRTSVDSFVSGGSYTFYR